MQSGFLIYLDKDEVQMIKIFRIRVWWSYTDCYNNEREYTPRMMQMFRWLCALVPYPLMLS